MHASETPPRSRIQRLFSLLTDLRFLRVLGQAVFLLLIVLALVQLWNNIVSALAANNLTPNLEFMNNRAGFEIGGAQNYTPDEPYWSAFRVGLNNTLSIIAAGLVGSTVLGVLGGIFLLSSNWLVRNITRAIVELLRNTPLLVQIFVMFFVVVLALPPLRESIVFPADGLSRVPTWWIGAALAAVVLLAAGRAWTAERRAAAWGALAGAVVVLAALFGLEQGADARYGQQALTHPSLLIVFVGCAGLALAGWRLAAGRRAALWGAAAGGLVAALAFTFGVVPAGGPRIETRPLFYLNNRGLTLPELHVTARFAEWAAFVAIGLGLGAALWLVLRRQTELTGRPYPRLRSALLVLLLFAAAGWLAISSEPAPQTVTLTRDGTLVEVPLDQARAEGLLSLDQSLLYSRAPVELMLPQRQGLRFSTGETLSPEYVALLLALVVYTAAFIAEVVRAGILAVPRGQLEAARALGLSYGQLLRLVILPQALRVIIPPLTNQYLNLAKNSSLAIAIAFADVYQVMNTVGNQSGQSVTSIIIVMLSYLIISLVISAVMNWVNARFQLVTR